MGGSNRSFAGKQEPPFERAIELRREAVAAMKLRLVPAAQGVSGVHPSESGASRRDAGQTRILAISDYEGLRTSREQVLRLEGFQVESATSAAGFDESWVQSFDIAILCQSIEAGKAARIARILRRIHPCIAILRVNPSLASSDKLAHFDYEMDALAGPRGLLHAIEVIGRKTAGH